MLTKEQIEMRRRWIGASEVPCILGVSPFGNEISVWCSKMGLDIIATTDEMELGNFLEAGIAQMYAHKTGYEIASFGSIAHPRFPFMGCTPDICVFGQSRIAQIKLVGHWMAHHWDDGVPEYVQAQVQAEMEVCDVEVCDVVPLIGGTDIRIIPVYRDREIGAGLVEICRAFWLNHIETGEMPPVDGSEHATAALKALYAQKRQEFKPATAEVEQWGRAWLCLDEKIDADKLEQSRFAQLIKTFIGEAGGVEAEAWRASWKQSKDGKRPFLLKPIGNMKRERAA